MIREKVKTADEVLGTGTVELFDDLTGRLYQREKFENFLSVQALMYQRQSIRADYARSLPAPQATQDPVPFPVLSHLAAWDDSSAESPGTEVAPGGKLIAFANKVAFGGADPQRGGVNFAESLNSPTQMKWVFDWPTSSANGTFQSLGWLAMNESNFGGTVPVVHQGWSLQGNRTLPLVVMGPNGNTTYGVTTVPATDKMYISYNGAVTEINPVTGAVIGTALFTNAGEQYIAYDPTGTPGFWLAKNTAAANPCLVKRTLAGTLVDQVNTTWTAIFGSAVTAVSLAHDGTYLYAVRASSPLVYKITPSTGASSSFSVAAELTAAQAVSTDPFGVVVGVKSHPTNTPFGESIFVVSRWSPTGKFMGKWMVSFAGNEPSFPMVDISYRAANAQHLLFTGDQTVLQRMAGFDLRCLGTRTLLGAPVTKDSSKSMKITYTFSFV